MTYYLVKTVCNFGLKYSFKSACEQNFLVHRFEMEYMRCFEAEIIPWTRAEFF